MLIRDRLGYIYQVPDSRLNGIAHVGYDGLGNPVGLPILPLLAPLITSLAPAVGSLVGGLFGGKKSEDAPPPPPPPRFVPPPPPPPPPPPIMIEPPPMPMERPCPPCPECPVCPVCGKPAADERPGPVPSAMPRPVRFVKVRRRRIHAHAR
jgi:hypothetical protein